MNKTSFARYVEVKKRKNGLMGSASQTSTATPSYFSHS